MRRLLVLTLAAALAVSAGCGERRAEMPGPTVNKFVGKLLADGKPVTFKEGDKVVLNLIHSSAQSFGVPIKPDGSFDVGEMPIGKYSAQLKVDRAPPASEKGSRAAPQQVMNVPGGFEIKEGQTEYTVELGKNFK